MAESPILVCEQLSKRFGTNFAVRDVSLHVDRGECAALVGRNGAGKTTILRMIVGATAPTSGQSLIQGSDSWTDGARARLSVGFVAEHAAFPRHLTGLELLRWTSQFYSNWDMVYAESLAERFGIPLRRRLGKLSKGMLSQLALILSIAHRPRLLLLDEPFGSLDPITRSDWREEIRHLCQDGGAACLFSTHLFEDVLDFSERVVIIARGEVCVDESMSHLCSGLYMCSNDPASATEEDVSPVRGVRRVCRCANGAAISIAADDERTVLQEMENRGVRCTPMDLGGLFREVSL